MAATAHRRRIYTSLCSRSSSRRVILPSDVLFPCSFFCPGGAGGRRWSEFLAGRLLAVPVAVSSRAHDRIGGEASSEAAGPLRADRGLSYLFIFLVAPPLPNPIHPLRSPQLLSSSTPLKLVSRYLLIAMEYAQARKRSLQVTHQLLRVREVDLRVTPVEAASQAKS